MNKMAGNWLNWIEAKTGGATFQFLMNDLIFIHSCIYFFLGDFLLIQGLQHCSDSTECRNKCLYHGDSGATKECVHILSTCSVLTAWLQLQKNQVSQTCRCYIKYA